MGKRVAQELIAEFSALRRSHGEAASWMRDLLTWQFVVGCSSHDVHNGLRWGCFDLAKGRGVCRDAFVASESLRNSMDILHDYAPMWLCSSLVYEDWAFENTTILWNMLISDPADVGELCDLDSVREWLSQDRQALRTR